MVTNNKFIPRERGYNCIDNWRRERLKEKKGGTQKNESNRESSTRKSKSTREYEKRKEISLRTIIERSKENEFSYRLAARVAKSIYDYQKLTGEPPTYYKVLTKELPIIIEAIQVRKL